MPHDEQKLRERAYELWMQDGCREGQSDRYWFQAQHELRSVGDQPAGTSRTLPQPSSDPMGAAKRPAATAKSKAGQKSPNRSRAIQAAQHRPG